MQSVVRYQHEVNFGKLKPGDMLLTNHPGKFSGRLHYLRS